MREEERGGESRGEARGARRRRLRRGVLLKLPFAARSLARLLNTCLPAPGKKLFHAPSRAAAAVAPATALS